MPSHEDDIYQAQEVREARLQPYRDDYVSDALLSSKPYRDALEAVMGGGTEWDELNSKVVARLYEDAKEAISSEDDL